MTKWQMLSLIFNCVNSGGYLALFSDPERGRGGGVSCFSIYQISWIKMKKVTFCKLKTSLSRNFVYTQ